MAKKRKYSEKTYNVGSKKYEHYYKTASSNKYERKETESLNQYYRRLAKQANQRMVRLEQISTPGSDKYNPAFKNVKSYAYEKFEREALASTRGKSRRFSESGNLNISIKEMQTRINVIREFLQSPTSTKGDIVTMYKKRAETLNKNWGTNFTWESLAKYFESGLFDKMAGRFESDGAFDTIGAIMKRPEEIIKAIESGEDIIDIVDDEVIASNIEDFVKSEGKDLKEFFGME